MFNQPFEKILLIPVNFGEIVAKSKHTPRPLTAQMCEDAYAQAEEEGVDAFWWVARFDPEEVNVRAR